MVPAYCKTEGDGKADEYAKAVAGRGSPGDESQTNTAGRPACPT